MDIGVIIFPTDKAIQPMDLAKECEDRGFESLWFPEHSHIPTSRETPWGGNPNLGPLPEMYWRTHDQFVALAAAAAVTKNLRLGTGITLVAQRDPIWLAKEVASLDMLSGGRLEFGIGYGWCVEEMRNHGLDYKKRRGILRDNILLMKELWTQDEASYSGGNIEFEKSWAWPKPVKEKGPRIMLGGAPGPTIFQHIAEFGNGWMPIGGSGIKASLSDLKKVCESNERDFSEISIVPFGTVPDQGKLDYFEELGVDEVILRVPAGPREQVLETLDSYVSFLK